MTAAALVHLVVSCPPNHPSGKRSRAGFTFSKVPQVIDVAQEQAEMIQKDPYLTIHSRTSRAWFLAHGLEFSADNLKKYAKQDPNVKEIKDSKTSQDAPGSTANTQTAQDTGKKTIVQGDAGGTLGTGNTPPAPTASPVFTTFSKKADIAEALVKFKGKKAGEEFNPDAPRDDLLALYMSLPDVTPAA